MARVLLIGSFWHGSIEESYARSFEQLGVEVHRFDFDQAYGKGLLRGFRPTEKLLRPFLAAKTSRLLVTYARHTAHDIAIVFKGRYIAPEAISALATLGPVFNFNPDSPWERDNTSRWLIESIPEYSMHLTWSKKLIPRFTEQGAKRVEYLPFGYDPVLHQPLVGSRPKLEYDLVFLGTFDRLRDELLATLGAFNIAIWGNGWKRARRVPRRWIKGAAVYGEESVRLLARGASVLNVLRPQNAASHNMRTFEIPATRFAMLTTRTAEQSSFFTEGEEMECYGSVNELAEKVRMLRDDRLRCERIGNAGYERGKDETYAKRASQILRFAGLA